MAPLPSPYLADPAALLPTAKELSDRLGTRVTFRDVSAALLLAVQTLLYDERDAGPEISGIPLSTALSKKNRPRTADAVDPLVLNFFLLVAFVDVQTLDPPRGARAPTLRLYRIANALLARLYEVGEWAAPWQQGPERERGPGRADPGQATRRPTRVRPG